MKNGYFFESDRGREQAYSACFVAFAVAFMMLSASCDGKKNKMATQSMLRPAVVARDVAVSLRGENVAMDLGEHGTWLWTPRAVKNAVKHLQLPIDLHRNQQNQVFSFSGNEVLLAMQIAQEPATSLLLWNVKSDQEYKEYSIAIRSPHFAISQLGDVWLATPTVDNATQTCGDEWQVTSLKGGEHYLVPIGDGRLDCSVGTVLLSSNGSTLAANISSGGWCAEAWDVRTGERVFSKDNCYIQAISGNGSTLCIRATDQSFTEFWDLQSNKLRFRTEAPIGTVALFPDGNRFLSRSKEFEVWSVAEKRRIVRLAHEPDFNPIATDVSADGLAIVASDALSIRIWDTIHFSETKLLASDIIRRE